MSKCYKFKDKEAVNFTTSTVDGWFNVFTRECKKNRKRGAGSCNIGWLLIYKN